ncbi:MAG: FkbM family methyltransferase [Sphingobacteriaceae bacterium]|nr:MAG: FkbM family methyltransferase [Sphingobacteriaceae bacterium]
MGIIKRLIPNHIKQKGKEFLMDVLKIPYSRYGVPLAILKWVKNDKPITFFDIGASVGHFSSGICKEYKIEKAILVEPVYLLIPGLESKFPDREIFHIMNIAVADSNDEADFYFNEEFDSISSLLRIDNGKEELSSLDIKEPALTKVITQTLDHITHTQQLNYIDLVKIDVQGAEHLVLNSGTETLKITRAVYTEFSFKPLYLNSSTFFDLYNMLYHNNFVLVSITPGFSAHSGELLQGDALFINKAFI